ncbi:unnamed protein product [Urochloa humidicola]
MDLHAFCGVTASALCISSSSEAFCSTKSRSCSATTVVGPVLHSQLQVLRSIPVEGTFYFNTLPSEDSFWYLLPWQEKTATRNSKRDSKPSIRSIPR